MAVQGVGLVLSLSQTAGGGGGGLYSQSRKILLVSKSRWVSFSSVLLLRMLNNGGQIKL